MIATQRLLATQWASFNVTAEGVVLAIASATIVAYLAPSSAPVIFLAAVADAINALLAVFELPHRLGVLLDCGCVLRASPRRYISRNLVPSRHRTAHESETPRWELNPLGWIK